MKLGSKDLIKNFELKEAPGCTITVHQATEGDEIERKQLFAKTRRVFNDDDAGMEVTVETDYNVGILYRKEAFLTLGSMTGFYLDDEETIEAFRSKDKGGGLRVRDGMSENEFNRVWGLLKPKEAAEIARCVRETNPEWGATGE